MWVEILLNPFTWTMAMLWNINRIFVAVACTKSWIPGTYYPKSTSSNRPCRSAISIHQNPSSYPHIPLHSHMPNLLPNYLFPTHFHWCTPKSCIHGRPSLTTPTLHTHVPIFQYSYPYFHLLTFIPVTTPHISNFHSTTQPTSLTTPHPLIPLPNHFFPHCFIHLTSFHFLSYVSTLHARLFSILTSSTFGGLTLRDE